MTKSSLTNVTVLANTNNYTAGRGGQKICKLTPHHMAGDLKIERCGELFQNPSRGASSNYGIGTDGRIACYVEEENRSHCSANGDNDRQAITVEVANDGGADTNWHISDKAWNSLVKLAVDVCTRHNFRLSYTGNASGSLTRHNMFVATTCPGPYLQSRFQELADTVNAILDGTTATTPNTSNGSKTIDEIAHDVITGKFGDGDARKTALANAGYDYATVQARVNEILGATPTPTTKSIEELAREVIAGQWGNGDARKTALTNAGYDFASVQAKVNELLGVNTSYQTYTVKSGDTLSAIAKKYNTTYTKIANDNGISNPNKIYSGQILKIY